MATKKYTKNVLKYSVHKYSSYTHSYLPENILTDDPGNQYSRWTSDSNNPPQYLILKLDRPAIVQSVLFGKYEKSHVCNIRKLKVYGGPQENLMVEIMSGGLRNDQFNEIFDVKCKLGGEYFSCRYVKIVPLQTWGPSFNFSIWHVQLHGIENVELVSEATKWFYTFKEREAVRLCLKHLRQQNYSEAFDSLQKRTRVQLEDPILTELHRLLVIEGDFEAAEELLVKCAKSDMFKEYLKAESYTPFWKEICSITSPALEEETSPATAPEDGGAISGAGSSGADLPGGPDDHHSYSMDQGGADSGGSGVNSPSSSPSPLSQQEVDSSTLDFARPGPRGGHQLCIDVQTETLYLFGGWDGQRDLADMWSYSVSDNQWTCLSADTSAEGGPSARSCHKMCLDPVRKKIFLLGRYLDNTKRTEANCKSDFYVYDVDMNTWHEITDDTAAMGGPKLVFDHQMCLDTEQNTLYVFGGRVLAPTNLSRDWTAGTISSEGGTCLMVMQNPASPEMEFSEPPFSGLFAYDVPTNAWHRLLDGWGHQPEIRSRIGHSMLFHEHQRKLYIFTGMRNKEHLFDLVTYNVDTAEVQVVYDGVNAQVPATGYTQRATIDCDLNEIHVLAGSSRNKERQESARNVRNTLWVYDINRNKWSCIYESDAWSAQQQQQQQSSVYPLSMANLTGTGSASSAASFVVAAGNNTVASAAAATEGAVNMGIGVDRAGFKAGSGAGSSSSRAILEQLRSMQQYLHEPCPRYAHQLVYDHIRKIHYLFGGNPGLQNWPKWRLNDFWSLKLKRTSSAELLHRCRLLIRHHRFKEMSVNDPMGALQYLQTELADTVDHTDPDEEREFQLLASTLFREPDEKDDSDDAEERRFRLRTELFDTIVEYFPEEMAQPKANLSDLLLHQLAPSPHTSC